MTLRSRLFLFGSGAAGLGALLVWALTGLPGFAAETSEYAQLLNAAAVTQRHATNVVAAVVFDYRGFDILGEEFIVLASVFGVALLLRDVRDETLGRPRDETLGDAVRWMGLAAAGLTALVGLYVLMHGYVTPAAAFRSRPGPGPAALPLRVQRSRSPRSRSPAEAAPDGSCACPPPCTRCTAE